MPRSDPNCIFCKISGGHIPAHRVLETNEAVAFLDIGPLADGHVLLIPKEHYEHLGDMSDESVTKVTGLLPQLCKAVQDVTQAEGYNVLQNNGSVAGQVVGHVHFHIIPRRVDDGLGYRWNAGSYPPGRSEELQARIASSLGVNR